MHGLYPGPNRGEPNIAVQYSTTKMPDRESPDGENPYRENLGRRAAKAEKSRRLRFGIDEIFPSNRPRSIGG
jgi:hypothetical protein